MKKYKWIIERLNEIRKEFDPFDDYTCEKLDKLIEEIKGETMNQCDTCGKMKDDCEDIVVYGIETSACGECRGVE